MTPNLRLNKKLTRQLINSSPDEEDKSSLLTINWNIDNQTKVFGSYYQGWFKSTMFFLQKIEEDRFRLVVSDGNPLCKFYLIDNIEEFAETIGVQILDMENTDAVIEALEQTASIPNCGIVLIEDGEVFVYEHENY
jgi:hypothetical protein